MNKTFFGILLVVCVLGMALALFSERLSREPAAGKPATQLAAAETPLPNLAASNSSPTEELPIVEEVRNSVPVPTTTDSPAGIAADVEEKEAREALAPPVAAPAPAAASEMATAAPPQPVPESRQSEAPALAPATPARPDPAAAAPAPDRPAPKPAAPLTRPDKAAPAAQPANAPARAASAKAGKITNFVVFARENGATIRMEGNGKIKYSSMNLENPSRLVVDMDGTWEFPARLPIPKNEMVTNIRVGKNGDKTRVVIDLKGKPRRSSMVDGQNGTRLDVRVDK